MSFKITLAMPKIGVEVVFETKKLNWTNLHNIGNK